MSYYEVLKKVEELSKEIGKVTTNDLKNSLGISERAIQESLKKLIKDGELERVYVVGNGGVMVHYKISKDKFGGCVNDLFKVISSLIR